MNHLKQFIIPFSGLKEGRHEYNFLIDQDFFECFEYSEIHIGNIEFAFTLHKQSTMLTLEFDFQGNAQVMCDRCATPFNLPLQGKKHIHVKFDSVAYEKSNEVVVIPENSYEIDISHFIYEFITLALPVKKTHPNEACDKEITDRLEQFQINTDQTSKPDPRWEMLKDIKT